MGVKKEPTNSTASFVTMRITRNISVKNTGTMVVTTTTRTDTDDIRDHRRHDDRVWQRQMQMPRVQQQAFVDMAGQLVTIDHEVPAEGNQPEEEDATSAAASTPLPTKEHRQSGPIFRQGRAVPPTSQDGDDCTTSMMTGSESTLSSSNLSNNSSVDEETNFATNLSVDMSVTTSCDATATTTSTNATPCVGIGFDEMDEYFLSVYGMNDGCSIQSKGKLPSDDIFDVSTSAPSSPHWSGISSSSSSLSLASGVSEMSGASTSTTRTTISRRRRHRGAAAARRRMCPRGREEGVGVHHHQIIDVDVDCNRNGDGDGDDEISCSSSVTSVTSAAARTINTTTTNTTVATKISSSSSISSRKKGSSSWIESMAEVCKQNAGGFGEKQWTPAKGWTSTSCTIEEEGEESEEADGDGDGGEDRVKNNCQTPDTFVHDENENSRQEGLVVGDGMDNGSSWANFDAAVF